MNGKWEMRWFWRKNRIEFVKKIWFVMWIDVLEVEYELKMNIILWICDDLWFELKYKLKIRYVLVKIEK